MSNQPSNWMTIREAALALAVSELTIRRRIKDGRLAHRLVNGKYYIDLQSAPRMLHPRDETLATQGEVSSQTEITPSASTEREADMPAPTEMVRPAPPSSPRGTLNSPEAPSERSVKATSGAGIDLDALLAEHARLAEVAGRARLLEDQLGQLSTRHEELQAGMLSLAGRNGWLESKLEERESEIKLLTDERPRLSWWKRLFRA